MTDYKKKRDEILFKHFSPQGLKAIDEAAQALDQLVMDVVGEAVEAGIFVDPAKTRGWLLNVLRDKIRTRLKEIMGGE